MGGDSSSDSDSEGESSEDPESDEDESSSDDDRESKHRKKDKKHHESKVKRSDKTEFGRRIRYFLQDHDAITMFEEVVCLLNGKKTISDVTKLTFSGVFPFALLAALVNYPLVARRDEVRAEIHGLSQELKKLRKKKGENVSDEALAAAVKAFKMLNEQYDKMQLALDVQCSQAMIFYLKPGGQEEVHRNLRMAIRKHGVLAFTKPAMAFTQCVNQQYGLARRS